MKIDTEASSELNFFSFYTTLNQNLKIYCIIFDRLPYNVNVSTFSTIVRLSTAILAVWHYSSPFCKSILGKIRTFLLPTLTFTSIFCC